MTSCSGMWVEKTTGPSAFIKSHSFDSITFPSILVSNCPAKCAQPWVPRPWEAAGRDWSREIPGDPGRLPTSWSMVPLRSSAHHPVSCWTPDSCIRAGFTQQNSWMDLLSHLSGSCLGLGDTVAVAVLRSWPPCPSFCLTLQGLGNARLLYLVGSEQCSCFSPFPRQLSSHFGLTFIASWIRWVESCFLEPVSSALCVDSSLWLFSFYTALILRWHTGSAWDNHCPFARRISCHWRIFEQHAPRPQREQRVCIEYVTVLPRSV